MQGRIPPNQRASARYTPKSEGGCKTTILGGSTAVLGLLSVLSASSGPDHLKKRFSELSDFGPDHLKIVFSELPRFGPTI
jgi:hypothetical protein